MRIAAIVNPFSGRRKAKRQWPILLQSLGNEAKRVDTFWSEYPGHSESIAASVRRSGYDRVIAVGGDGTLFEVLNGLWWEDNGDMPTVGTLPFGTGCDYVRNFEIGTGMAERLQTAVSGPAVKVSLGRCRYELQGGIRQRVFAMVLGLGFDAEVVYRYEKSRLRSCWLSYAFAALTCLRELRAFSIDGTLDDSTFQTDAVFFGAAVGCCLGKGMRIAPGASPSSNRFECILATPVSPLRLLSPILRAYLRQHVYSPNITRIKASRAKIRLAEPIRFEADGQLLGRTSMIEMDLIPEAFSFAGNILEQHSRNQSTKTKNF